MLECFSLKRHNIIFICESVRSRDYAQLERRQCFFYAKLFVQRGSPRARVRIVKFNTELKNTQIE